jgi:SAM-dependent methyltransferase
VEACRICGSGGVENVVLGRTPAWHCSNCGAAFTAGPASERNIEDYYRDAYEITGPDAVSTEKRRWSRLPEQARLLADLAGLLPPGAAILDVGCDKGYFLDEARRYGYRVAGVEPSRTARDYCRRIGLDVRAALEDVKEEFDVVTLWHSLEHLPDPVEFLTRCRQRLRPGGILAIRVPDFDCLWRKILADRWIWFQPQHHCCHFRAVSLRIAVERAGFEVIRLRSQRPNDLLTRRAGRLAGRVFWRYRGYREPPRKMLASIVEELTGVELYLIGTKR